MTIQQRIKRLEEKVLKKKSLKESVEDPDYSLTLYKGDLHKKYEHSLELIDAAERLVQELKKNYSSQFLRYGVDSNLSDNTQLYLLIYFDSPQILRKSAENLESEFFEYTSEVLPYKNNSKFNLRIRIEY